MCKPGRKDVQKFRTECALSMRLHQKPSNPMSQTVREIAERIAGEKPPSHTDCDCFVCESIALASHVLASTEPLRDEQVTELLRKLRSMEMLQECWPETVQDARKYIAGLRDQLQATQQERDNAETERDLLYIERNDSDRKITELQQSADELGREIEIYKTRYVTRTAYEAFKKLANERGREVAGLRAALTPFAALPTCEQEGAGIGIDAPLRLWIKPEDVLALRVLLTAPAATPPAQSTSTIAAQESIRRFRDPQWSSDFMRYGYPVEEEVMPAQPDEWPADEDDGIYPPAQEHPDTAALNWLDAHINYDTDNEDRQGLLSKIDGYLRGSRNIRWAINAARTAPEEQG